MMDGDAIVRGACRCGATRISVEGAPILTMACHCEGCQKMSASAFSLSALYPSARFEILEGEPVRGGLRGPFRHYFCPSCLSWMLTRPPGMDEIVNLRATMLENARDFTPFVEFHTRERLSWATTPAVHSFETTPPMEAFPALIEAFARTCGAQA